MRRQCEKADRMSALPTMLPSAAGNCCVHQLSTGSCKDTQPLQAYQLLIYNEKKSLLCPALEPGGVTVSNSTALPHPNNNQVAAACWSTW